VTRATELNVGGQNGSSFVSDAWNSLGLSITSQIEVLLLHYVRQSTLGHHALRHNISNNCAGWNSDQSRIPNRSGPGTIEACYSLKIMYILKQSRQRNEAG